MYGVVSEVVLAGRDGCLAELTRTAIVVHRISFLHFHDGGRVCLYDISVHESGVHHLAATATTSNALGFHVNIVAIHVTVVEYIQAVNAMHVHRVVRHQTLHVQHTYLAVHRNEVTAVRKRVRSVYTNIVLLTDPFFGFLGRFLVDDIPCKVKKKEHYGDTQDYIYE